MMLPRNFCWTRFGTEAGQSIGAILSRKEQERSANSGTFLWGIGNAVGPSLLKLVMNNLTPEVLFSPIKSRPKSVDVAPECVAAWTSAVTMDGEDWVLPSQSMVTSRVPTDGRKVSHYALVCHSSEPLKPESKPQMIDMAAVENLISGRPIGASQVTAIVRFRDGNRGGNLYPVAIRVQLIAPYFITLRNPVIIERENLENDWTSAVSRTWQARQCSNLPNS